MVGNALEETIQASNGISTNFLGSYWYMCIATFLTHIMKVDMVMVARWHGGTYTSAVNYHN